MRFLIPFISVFIVGCVELDSLGSNDEGFGGDGNDEVGENIPPPSFIGIPCDHGYGCFMGPNLPLSVPQDKFLSQVGPHIPTLNGTCEVVLYYYTCFGSNSWGGDSSWTSFGSESVCAACVDYEELPLIDPFTASPQIIEAEISSHQKTLCYSLNPHGGHPNGFIWPFVECPENSVQVTCPQGIYCEGSSTECTCLCDSGDLACENMSYKLKVETVCEGYPIHNLGNDIEWPSGCFPNYGVDPLP